MPAGKEVMLDLAYVQSPKIVLQKVSGENQSCLFLPHFYPVMSNLQTRIPTSAQHVFCLPHGLIDILQSFNILRRLPSGSLFCDFKTQNMLIFSINTGVNKDVNLQRSDADLVLWLVA